HNLVKLISLSWIEGHYYKPRIDWELIGQYHDGLIATSSCLAGEIPKAILNGKHEAAENLIIKFKKIFGHDFYLELIRHETNLPGADTSVYKDQVIVNEKLIELAKKYDVKLIATNDVHFINAGDAEAHDRLICLTTNSDINDPARLRYTKQEWLKTRSEMADIFQDIPEALENTMEIVEKVERYELNRPPVMPGFPIPVEFSTEEEYRIKFTEENLRKEFDQKTVERLGDHDKLLRIKFESDYLQHLVYKGAEERYGPEPDKKIRERIDFELGTIKNMGFPSYFLIVWDFLKAAREMGVTVGPGRGSAAGSVVAYCLRITDIDPLRYNLLFERFLNPDRISLPDIDIDFDDDGREKVLKYVEKKYGHNRVANIITFGTMAARSSIRDVARIQNLSLDEADHLAKLVPERPGVTLKDAFNEVPELKEEKNSPREEIASVLRYAEVLEGSVRHTGVHACGIIISHDNLINYLPVATSKDSELLVTQYDGKHVEAVGMLKMDFLGLKTLSIINDTIANIKLSKGIDIDINAIPLDDGTTYELYSRGDTTGLFQFESDGMKKYLRELKPTKFEDLIAMNALYRPGPMDYIPDFINRKHGKEKIVYDFPIMKEVLEETYGITVYQEQVMQLSRIMAGFTGGEADSLRKAMGKKIQSMMNELKPKFFQGCKNLHGLEEKEVLKVWNDWDAFAKYAFNKSHATCYSYVSYQTGYLKAQYPAEFMSAVLSRNLSDIKKITFFMDECKRMGINVLGPDINESHIRFTVNREGHIRFGLNAIKGVGESAVLAIIEERDRNGSYTDIYDFVERVGLHSVNKKCIEALAISGAFDCFELKRNQYFSTNEKDTSFIENLIKYGNRIQKDKSAPQQTLFGSADDISIVKPLPPVSREWSTMERLNKEKELIGIFLSAHPLDTYKLELETLNPVPLGDLTNLNRFRRKELTLAGIVTSARSATAKNGKPYGTFSIEDYSGSFSITLFGKDFLNFGKFLVKDYALFLKGTVQSKQYGSDPDAPELKIKHIDMLAHVREDLINSIMLKIPVENLSEQLIDEIYQLAEKNKGKTMLKFLIYEPANKVWVEMFSRTHRLNLSGTVIDYLENNSDIEFKFNI
ncbi:MAG: DNA polymerase III subunit alpha, partial [Bacteroidetes bacterium]|nr:DNA polymerase III subunit alpha [Bacteroidota bacterium]